MGDIDIASNLTVIVPLIGLVAVVAIVLWRLRRRTDRPMSSDDRKEMSEILRDDDDRPTRE
jgi:FtsZ-interacting cell division protein ZipA